MAWSTNRVTFAGEVAMIPQLTPFPPTPASRWNKVEGTPAATNWQPITWAPATGANRAGIPSLNPPSPSAVPHLVLNAASRPPWPELEHDSRNHLAHG